MPRPLREFLIGILSAVMLSACSASPPSPTPKDDSQDSSTAEQSASPDQDADAADQATSCVEACVMRNQMRATSIEQIRQDCATECDQGTPTPGL